MKKIDKEKIIHQTKYATLFSSKDDYLVYNTPDLVVVLPVLPNGDLLLIEQERIPVEKRLLEPVTGGIVDKEEPKEAAIRETKEETGYDVKEVEYVGSYYSAPGYMSQKAYVFIAYVDKFIGTALESHEKDFGLTSHVVSTTDAITYATINATSPYLSIALNHLTNNKLHL